MLGWYEVEHAGMYTLQLSNLCGISSDSIMVLFEDQIALLDLEDRYDWCEGDSILLDATQSFPAEYHWSSGDATPMLLVTEPGQYTVQVFAPCNVASHETIIEKSGDCLPIPAFYFPNVFSPNGDNINDQFTFSVGQEVEIVSASAMIYDRWGNQVFSANAFPFAWDGDFEDKLLMPGAYVYVVKISYKARGQIQHVSYSGDVTLIR